MPLLTACLLRKNSQAHRTLRTRRGSVWAAGARGANHQAGRRRAL